MCVLRNVLIFGGVFFFFWVKAGLFFSWAGSVSYYPFGLSFLSQNYEFENLTIKFGKFLEVMLVIIDLTHLNPQ